MTLPDGPGSRPSRTLTWVEKVRAGPLNIFDSRSRAVHSDSISTTPFSRKAVTPGSPNTMANLGHQAASPADVICILAESGAECYSGVKEETSHASKIRETLIMDGSHHISGFNWGVGVWRSPNGGREGRSPADRDRLSSERA